MEWIATHLSLILFFVLAIALFCGYPVAFVLGGIAILFGAIGMLLDVFMPVQFFNLLPRIRCSPAMPAAGPRAAKGHPAPDAR